jgi:hypothetical protein
MKTPTEFAYDNGWRDGRLALLKELEAKRQADCAHISQHQVGKLATWKCRDCGKVMQ